MDIHAVNAHVIEQFRAGGPVEGMNRDRLLLLTTRGRRSGEPRTTPMMFHRVDDQLVVMASNAGATREPDWFLNLVAEPRVHVEIGDDSFDARAVPAADGERERLWSAVVRAYPFFAEHQQRAGRSIPVVVLTRC